MEIVPPWPLAGIELEVKPQTSHSDMSELNCLVCALLFPQVLMLTLENPPPSLETCGDLNGVDYRKNYSKSFQKMVEKCLQRDPEKR